MLLTEEEINSVGWYCKNTEELQLFLKSRGFRTNCTNIPSKKYIVGGDFLNMFGATSSLRTRKEVEFIDNNLYWKENKMESEAEVSYMYGEIQELESNIDYEIDRTMGTLECTNLPEDVRAEFLYHLSCLLEKVRDNL